MSAPMPGDRAAGPGAGVGEADLIAEGARAIVRANGAAMTASDEWWAGSVAHHRRMVAEHGDTYANSRSLVTDAMRASEAAFRVFRPAPEPGDGGGDARLRAAAGNIDDIDPLNVPDGYVIVPIRPTADMLCGAGRALHRLIDSVPKHLRAARWGEPTRKGYRIPEDEKHAVRYHHMLLHAPRPSTSYADRLADREAKLAAAERALAEARDAGIREGVEMARSAARSAAHRRIATGDGAVVLPGDVPRVLAALDAVATQLAGPARGQGTDLGAEGTQLAAKGTEQADLAQTYGHSADPAEPGRAGVRRAVSADGGSHG